MAGAPLVGAQGVQEGAGDHQEGQDEELGEVSEYERIRVRSGEALAVRVRERLKVARAELELWRAVHAHQVADGVVGGVGPDGVGAGD